MDLLAEIGLVLVALLLFYIITPIAFIYALLPKRRWYKRTILYFKKIAYSIDQLGNTIVRDLFNDIMIKDNTLAFGKPDETISSVMGKNKLKNNLTKVGLFLDSILEKLDSNHSIKSIERDE